MKSPFPYFGGKATIAAEVWARFGDTPNYVEPFAGSAAMLLARPDDHDWQHAVETINDRDGFVSNFWRAVQHDPEAVAHYADWPVIENDLHARHSWLVREGSAIVARLDGDPEFYDAKIAGWWVWGINSWIGSGWCAGVGPWQSIDGELINVRGSEGGTWRKLPHLHAGQGINRQRPHLGDAGQGINRQRPHLGDAGRGGCAEWTAHLVAMMRGYADRLRRVRVCSGDWTRVCGETPTVTQGLTAVFLDPPYAMAGRADLYRQEMTIATEVREWAIARGDDPRYRIALCGYEGEHEMPGWTAWSWKAHGGYGLQGDETRGRDNRHREMVWFSSGCLGRGVESLPLFAALAS